jgi:hypothetical protein
MNLGGPVWHASVCSHDMKVSQEELERSARKALKDVGDASLGEWTELNLPKFLHIRRRLSLKEQSSIGPVVDIRGTQEAINRVNAIWLGIPLVVKNTIMQDGPF